MSIRKKPNGKWEVRWRPTGAAGPRDSRTFDLKGDAEKFETAIKTKMQMGGVVNLDRGRITVAEFVETYWRLHAIPNLSDATRGIYGQTWEKHLRHRIGGRHLREITPGHIVRLRSDLEQARVGAPTVRKALAFLQGVLTFAIVDGQIDTNPAAQVRKPKDVRQRTPHIFAPLDVERIRGHLDIPSATLVSVLAYAGPRPEEALRLRVRDIGEQTIRFDGRKTGGRERFTPLLAPLAGDLRELHLATGRRGPNAPVFAAHDGGHWQPDDYRNWRRRAWQAWIGGDPRCTHDGQTRCDACGATRLTPSGSRPRDLRGSYVTLRAYEGVPLTTIGREVGCSVVMLDRHYAGVLAEWDGTQTPADKQIANARQQQTTRKTGGANG